MIARRQSLTLIAPSAPISRFDAHRAAVEQRTTLELASEIAKLAADKAARAASMLGTASALPDRRAILRDGTFETEGWLALLRGARHHLDEVLGEIDR